eukprot:gene7845-5668_t
MSVNTVVIILRSECPASRRIKARFEELGIAYYALDLERRDDGAALQAALADLAGAVPSCAERRGQVVCPSKGLPRVFVRGQHVGGAVETSRAFESGELAHLAADNGGGEGGGDDGGDEGGEQCAEPSAGPKPADGRAEASPRRTSVAGERLSVRARAISALRGVLSVEQEGGDGSSRCWRRGSALVLLLKIDGSPLVDALSSPPPGGSCN